MTPLLHNCPSQAFSLVRPVLLMCVGTSVGLFHLAEDPPLPSPPVITLLVNSMLADLQERLRAVSVIRVL